MPSDTGQRPGPGRLLLPLALATVAFAPLIEGGTTHLPVFILRTLVVALFTAFLLSGIRRGTLFIIRTPVDIPVGLFITASLVSVFVAPYKYMAVTWLQTILFHAMFLYLARTAVSVPGGVDKAVLLVLGMGAVESVWGLVQWLQEGGRAGGSFFNPNMLSGYVVPACVMAVSLMVHGHAWAKARHGAAGLAVLAAACAAAVVASGSRGGALALAAGLSVVLWSKSRRLAAAAALVLVVALAAFPNPVRDRILEYETGGGLYAYSRTGIWEGAARMAADHPMGVGLGQFKYYWPKYNFPIDGAVIKYGKQAATAHNEYLHIWAETGYAGAAAFLFGVFLLARALARPLAGSAGGQGGMGNRAASAGLAGGIAAVLVHATVDSNLHEPGIVFLLLLLAAAAFELHDGGGKAFSVEIPPEKRRRLAAMSFMLVLLLAVWAARPALAYHFSGLGRDALKSGRARDAERLTGLAILLEPGNASYHDQAASVRYARSTAGGGEEEFDAALDELGEARRLNRTSATYPVTEGRLLMGRAAASGDNADGRGYAVRALGLYEYAEGNDPYNAMLLFEKARAQLFLGRTGDAEATLKKLLGYEPNFLAGRLLLAGVYKAAGRELLSREECYSIISIRKTLDGVPLDSTDRAFVDVDMKKVEEMLGSSGRVGK